MNALPPPAGGAHEGRTSPQQGIDLAVALDLVMLERGLSADQAYELMRVDAESSGRDLQTVASDVIDLGTSRLRR